jgi:phage shock protein PspC (stress-responsive transcriptional regulator)
MTGRGVRGGIAGLAVQEYHNMQTTVRIFFTSVLIFFSYKEKAKYFISY